MTFPRNLKLLDVVVGPDWPWLYSFRYQTNFCQQSLRDDFPKKFKAPRRRCGTRLALALFVSTFCQQGLCDGFSTKFKAPRHHCGTTSALTIFVSVSDQLLSTKFT